MRYRLLITFMMLMISAVVVSAQEQEKEAVPISFADEKAQFAEGNNKFQQWVKGHQVYPREALELGLQGRVTIRFTISEKGKLKGVEVVSGIHKSLNDASVRIIKASAGLWTPGKDSYGKPCSTTLLFPVIWELPK